MIPSPGSRKNLGIWKMKITSFLVVSWLDQACFKEALGWDRVPYNLQDFFDEWLPLNCNKYHVKFFCFDTVLWSTWNARNKMGIEKRFPRSKNEVFHKTFSFFTEMESAAEKRGCKVPTRHDYYHEAVAGGVLGANRRNGN
jgi:hypothetical protein